MSERPAHGRARHAIVVADGDAPDADALAAAWPGWTTGVDLVIAADGGAIAAAALGLRIDAVVGDMDSLDEAALERLAAESVEIVRSPAEKDETDTELAIIEAIGRGAARLTIVAALGGPRLDHELANVALLAHPALVGVPAILLGPTARVRLVTAPGSGGEPVEHRLPGPNGATISVLPIGGDAIGVSTAGLRYPLRDETLPFGSPRGVSNERLGPVASITLRGGRLLVVEVAVTLDP